MVEWRLCKNCAWFHAELIQVIHMCTELVWHLLFSLHITFLWFLLENNSYHYSPNGFTMFYCCSGLYFVRPVPAAHFDISMVLPWMRDLSHLFKVFSM